MIDNIKIVDVTVPVQGIISVEAWQVGVHARRYEIVDTGTASVDEAPGCWMSLSNFDIIRNSFTTMLVHVHHDADVTATTGLL